MLDVNLCKGTVLDVPLCKWFWRQEGACGHRGKTSEMVPSELWLVPVVQQIYRYT